MCDVISPLGVYTDDDNLSVLSSDDEAFSVDLDMGIDEDEVRLLYKAHSIKHFSIIEHRVESAEYRA
jgi:hypothetical protein